MCSPNKLDIKLIICNTIFLKMSKFTSSRTKLTCNFFMRRKLLHLRFELHIIFGSKICVLVKKIKYDPPCILWIRGLAAVIRSLFREVGR